MELRPHDLLRLNAPDAVETVDPPAWVARSLAAAPWAVVRRAPAPSGKAAIGLRGDGRSERLAGFVALAAVAERASPEDLAPGGRLWRLPDRDHPSFAALVALAPALDALGFAWGPAGGAGYEIATGRQVLTDASDLDLVLRAPFALELARLAEVAASVAAAPVRVDVQVETAIGAASLTELLRDDAVMIRTAEGPRLVDQAMLASGSSG